MYVCVCKCSFHKTPWGILHIIEAKKHSERVNGLTKRRQASVSTYHPIRGRKTYRWKTKIIDLPKKTKINPNEYRHALYSPRTSRAPQLFSLPQDPVLHRLWPHLQCHYPFEAFPDLPLSFPSLSLVQVGWSFLPVCSHSVFYTQLSCTTSLNDNLTVHICCKLSQRGDTCNAW